MQHRNEEFSAGAKTDKRRLVGALAFIVVLSVAFLILLSSTKGKTRPMADTVAVQFTTFTNDAAGRSAIFLFTNRAPIAIKTSSRHNQQILMSNAWKDLGLVNVPSVSIEANGSAFLKVSAPTSNLPWKVWFNYFENPGLFDQIRMLLAREGRRRFSIESDIAPALSTNSISESAQNLSH